MTDEMSRSVCGENFSKNCLAKKTKKARKIGLRSTDSNNDFIFCFFMSQEKFFSGNGKGVALARLFL